MTFRKAGTWEDAFFGPIEDAMAEQALAEAREDDLTGASPIWLHAACLRCGRSWQPRVPEPKQCRWCHSRSWRSPRGTVRRGRPRLAEKKD